MKDCDKRPYRVGLVGLGTIGTGVARILLEHSDRVTQAAGRKVELACICDKDLTRERSITLPEGLLTDDLSKIQDDPSIDLVVELAGGTGFARTLVLSMLERGKNIVTANKALVANNGPEIFSTARKHGKTIAFEAAVCGGIPILNALQTSLQGNKIQSLEAIVNGTSNFILSQMEEKGADYSDAVREAQQLGYAEADPTLDVDGSDAAQKLAILAQLGFHLNVDWKTIPKQGIQEVQALDIHAAKEMGYRIRLLAVARLSKEASPQKLELHVSPTLIPEDTFLANVKNAFNAVQIKGNAVGPIFLHGYGAGELPTASSVVGDIIDTALGRTAITFSSLNYWSETPCVVSNVELENPDEIVGKTYLRLLVEDRPGVLHEISGVLGKLNISIASMIQHDPHRKDGPIPMMITTHNAKEGDMLQAIERISQLGSMKGKPVRMRVLDLD